MNYNPLLLTDFYKACHHAQYNKDIEYITSYYTPRMTRLENQDDVVMFGLQSFIQEYFIEKFNSNFFNRNKVELMDEYKYLLEQTIGHKVADDAYDKVSELYDLGYLPIKVNAIPEGTLVPIKVPMFEITNTHPEFAWLVNALETLMSTSLWHGMISATVGYQYRQIANKWYEKTVESGNPKFALGDFSFRGQESVESGIKSSAGFLLSHMNTATVPAIPYLAHYYDTEFESVGRGAISTEHSVMCSNYSIDGDEETFVKKLITEIYPNEYVSMVSDSYDYWNMVENILPSLKSEILNREGGLGVRGDSGDPIEIVAGWGIVEIDEEMFDSGKIIDKNVIYKYEDSYFILDNEGVYLNKFKFEDLPVEALGTVATLWNYFEGSVNSKGYKVLPPQIKVVYGDSITQQRAEEIYRRLADKEFSAQNVTLGAGSFSMQAVENEDGQLSPYTRDTFGVAIKATHGKMKDGSEIFILKDPKTDTGNFKKSLEGLVDVRINEDGTMYAVDQLKSTSARDTIMREVFKNSELTNKETLSVIRDRLHNNEF